MAKLSRIGRSTQHLIQLMNLFQEREREVEFCSLSEKIDTKTAMGRKGGRPNGLSAAAKKRAADLLELRKAGFSVRKVCEMLDLGSTATYYAYLAHAEGQG